MLGDFNGWTLNRFLALEQQARAEGQGCWGITTVMDALSIYRLRTVSLGPR